MNNTTKLLTSCAAALLLGLPLAGCASNDTDTEGARTIRKADQLEEAGEMQMKGEKMVRDGEAMVARGKTLKEQGDEMEGDRVISQGEERVDEGQRMVRQAKDMRPNNNNN